MARSGPVAISLFTFLGSGWTLSGGGSDNTRHRWPGLAPQAFVLNGPVVLPL